MSGLYHGQPAAQVMNHVKAHFTWQNMAFASLELQIR